MTETPRLIKFRFTTIDRFSESRTFKTLTGARKYVEKRLGTHYDLSAFGHAVDMFGTGKLEMTGATWAEVTGREEPA